MQSICHSCRHYDPTVEEENCEIHNAFLSLVRLTGAMVVIGQCPSYEEDAPVVLDISVPAW